MFCNCSSHVVVSCLQRVSSDLIRLVKNGESDVVGLDLQRLELCSGLVRGKKKSLAGQFRDVQGAELDLDIRRLVDD